MVPSVLVLPLSLSRSVTCSGRKVGPDALLPPPSSSFLIFCLLLAGLLVDPMCLSLTLSLSHTHPHTMSYLQRLSERVHSQLRRTSSSGNNQVHSSPDQCHAIAAETPSLGVDLLPGSRSNMRSSSHATSRRCVAHERHASDAHRPPRTSSTETRGPNCPTLATPPAVTCIKLIQ